LSGKSPVEEFLEKARGFWLRAEHVKVGDRIEILDEPMVDEKTFDKPYIVFRGRLLRTGDEYNVRLGPRNVQRIAETLGTKSWKGKQIEVISIENYPGLGKKGILFRGVAEGGKAAGSKPASGPQLSPETIDTIRKSRDIAEMGIGLTESDFGVLPAQTRAELLKYNYVIKKQVEGTTYYFFDRDKCRRFWQKA